MNFFKSVFADDPDPPNFGSESAPATTQDPDPNPSQPDPTSAGIGGWNLGDLIKTIATKSETVIETYRRDLQEFGSGLKKEIEVAQGSLETVGTKIDELGTTVLQGTAQIISQGMLGPDHESDSNTQGGGGYSSQRSLNSKTYSRFESQVHAIQGDVSTYCEEPEDLEEYRKWRSEFALEEKREEIEGLLEENGAMESIYKRVAPSVVDDETFWCRYYFRVYKLKQAESVRANLVKRAISVEEDDEELSWDVDDDEYDESGSNAAVAKSSLGKTSEVAAEDVKEKDVKVGDKSSAKETESVSESSEQKVVGEESSAEKLPSETSKVVEEKEGKSLNEKKENAVGSSSEKETEKQVNVEGDSAMPSKLDEEKKVNVDGDSGKKEVPAKSDDKAAVEVKNEAPAYKESGVSAASVQPSAEHEEEDLGWDEIEDLSSIDEKKANPGVSGGSTDRAVLQKRLSTAEEEDLSWDIDDDDDDEPAKA